MIELISDVYTVGLCPGNIILWKFLNNYHRAGLVSDEEFESILLAFEDMQLKMVSQDRLDKIDRRKTYEDIRKEVFLRKSPLIEAVFVIDVERGVYDFSKHALKVFTIILQCFLE